MNRKVRLGHIQFLNMLPVYYGLAQENLLEGLDLVKGTPTELSRQLMAGELDVAPIPSIEYARHYGETALLPKISVGSDGAIMSIMLVSKVPIDQLDGRSVALSGASASSQVLLKILLRDRYGVRPRFFEAPQDLAQMLREADAALLIGDEALRANYTKDGQLFKYDLGIEWKEYSGMKMVYAVWACRKEFARDGSQVKKVYASLQRSLEYSEARLDEVAEYAARWEQFPAQFLREYFGNLRYDFTDDCIRGLLHFFRKAEEIGELNSRITRCNFVEVN